MAKAKAKAKAKPKSRSAEAVKESTGEVAKNIWLAGLGAYGKAYDEAKSRVEKASKDTPKLFKDLVKKGEQLDAKPEGNSVDNTLTRARADIEERLQAVRENLGFGHLFGSHNSDLKRLEEKVDQLAKKVDALSRAATKKTTPKKPAAKKPAAKKKTAVSKK